MDKHIIIFGAGKSATYLINYLIRESLPGWQITVADSSLTVAASKTGNALHARAVGLQVNDAILRTPLISSGDLIISMLPPALHHLVARDCVELGKHLLTASYVDDNMRSLAVQVAEMGLLFLSEMGLDPGIDHMSAMQMIDAIHREGGKITAFRSHCGGLIAPQYDDNPWHYKISWNPYSVVRAGSQGARYKENNCLVERPYHELFNRCSNVSIPGLGMLACYPNRDSLPYMPLYRLNHAATFIRTTLRYPEFCAGWNCLVLAGLTDDQVPLAGEDRTFRKWSAPLKQFITPANNHLFTFLGLLDDLPVPDGLRTSAAILQHLLETRLPMQPQDKDMIVMLHELTYVLDGKSITKQSTLLVTGEDSNNTAMARTVGLPLGIAAKLILQGKLSVTGLHIPVIPEIYEPVMQELAMHGISFKTDVTSLNRD